MTRTLSIAVTLTRGDHRIDVAFDCPPGVTGLIGPSGAGKTTVAQTVAGIARPDGGRIAIGDRVLFDATQGIDVAPENRRVGYVFQDMRLFPHLTARQNLAYGHRRGQDRGLWERIADLLELAPLMDRRPSTLSGGESRRVAIGRALLTNPDVLILDEPMAGLDPARRARLEPHLRHVRDAVGIPIIFITHQLPELLDLADMAVLMVDGRLVAAGPVGEVFAEPAMAGYLGDADGGVVLDARVSVDGHGLYHLTVDGGSLITVQPPAPVGGRARVRVLARDVAIARERPAAVSILNVLAVRVVAVTPRGGDQVDVTLALADKPCDRPAQLVARITAHSANQLGIEPGLNAYALVKAVAVSRHWPAGG